jgi:hypothetical protein
MAEGMALSRQGRGRRQVETVWTGMGFGQIAVLRVWPLGQLCIARVDLDYFDHLRELTAPSQPPPLVTALRRGDECDVTAVVSGYELAAEGTFVRYGILRDRGQRQQLGGADGEHGAAASLLVPPRPGGTRHAATVPERCDFDTGPNGSACVRKGLAQRLVVAAAIFGGRRVSIRIVATTLTFFDAETRRLLRTRPSPLTEEEVARLGGLRPRWCYPRCGSNCSGRSPPPAESTPPTPPATLVGGVGELVGRPVRQPARVHRRHRGQCHDAGGDRGDRKLCRTDRGPYDRRDRHRDHLRRRLSGGHPCTPRRATAPRRTAGRSVHGRSRHRTVRHCR